MANITSKKTARVLNYLLLLGLLIYFFLPFGNTYSGAALLSVSSDGRYVITSHYGHYLILWDIDKREKKIINQHTNLNSAYFIPQSHLFMWQHDQTNVVTIQDVNGVIKKTIPLDFAVYGHVMSHDLSAYIASKDNWELVQVKHGITSILKRDFGDVDGSALLMKLKLSEPYLLTTVDGDAVDLTINGGRTLREANPNASIDLSLLNGVVLWDITQSKPVEKFYGLAGKAFSDISANQQYVVATSDNFRMFSWDIASGKRLLEFDNPVQPNTKCYGNATCLERMAKKIREKKTLPADFKEHPLAHSQKSVALKYIDTQGHIIRFLQAINYATLYHEKTPEILEYMSLGDLPRPNVYSVFSSANTIDTAPNAQILVMAANTVGDYTGFGSGIIVYHFDEKTKTLERLWAPEGPGPHRRINNPLNDYDG